MPAPWKNSSSSIAGQACLGSAARQRHRVDPVAACASMPSPCSCKRPSMLALPHVGNGTPQVPLRLAAWQLHRPAGHQLARPHANAPQQAHRHVRLHDRRLVPLPHGPELLAGPEVVELLAPVGSGRLHGLLPEHVADELLAEHGVDFVGRALRTNPLGHGVHADDALRGRHEAHARLQMLQEVSTGALHLRGVQGASDCQYPLLKRIRVGGSRLQTLQRTAPEHRRQLLEGLLDQD
mmetsp:Transcript_26584/g.82758  ORF Transcript_26584/g.82758 Transcript_26584/m.82758 type:complete len:237 (+) Transcript_26584:381-1091(+)